MKKIYNLYRDSKHTIWRRDYFDVEAESIEEAVNMIVKDNCCPVDSELLHDTEEGMFPSENNNQSTEEIFYKDELLYGNQNK